ncbi:hypothetical protein QT654_20620 [Xanthomonas citri pv. citri]
MSDKLKDAMCDAIRETLGDALDCGRVWSAWQVGTMGEDDFSRVADDPERVAEIADAVLLAMRGQQLQEAQPQLNYERMFVDACAALAEVSRELGCDPDQGGAEPILAAIAELRSAAQPQAEQQGAGEALPPLPIAFFDEFGRGADDRVQDYARAAIVARQPVGEGEVRAQFEAWLPPSWSREGQADSEGDFVYHEDWVQGAWVTWRKLGVSQTADVFAAYEMWPDDLKARLSAHDLRRMNGWAPRTHAGDWRIDTSAGGPILVYKDCSVIEGEDARYVLSLIVKDALQPVGKNQVAEYQYRFWNDEMPGWSSWQPISKSDYERELVEPFEGREVRALYAAPTGGAK